MKICLVRNYTPHTRKFDIILRVSIISIYDKKITIEDLAVMVKRGFDEVNIRFDQTATKKDLEEDLAQLHTELRTEMHAGFQHVNARLDVIHQDISDLPDIREELKDHGERLTRMEHKVRLMK